jgi:acylphosphatase
MTTQVIRHIVLRGRVQGVGFRAFVERERSGARSGLVRRRDNSVRRVRQPPTVVAR